MKSVFKNPVPSGIGMNRLRGSKNRFLRQEFWKLSEPKQERVKAMVERHVTACKSFHVPMDPEIFVEVITDIRDDKM